MVQPSSAFWHTVGYTAERARSAVGDSGGGVTREGARENGGGNVPGNQGAERPMFSSALGRFAVATAASVGVRLMEKWLVRKAPGIPRLLRGATAGVGAAGILAATRHVMGVRIRDDAAEPDLLDELLEGAGHGLVYAALVDPNLPGPPIFKGLVLGTVEHFTSPWGGVLAPLQGAAPHSKVPGLERLLSPLDVVERPLFDHLLYATLLAALYGSHRDRRKRKKGPEYPARRSFPWRRRRETAEER